MTKLFVALLRGINVGGKNLIKMTDLKACFEAMGLSDVQTYIQSGNVVFRADDNAKALTTRIEDALTGEFGYEAKVVVRSHTQLRNVVNAAPDGFGQRSGVRDNVVFLKEPLTAPKALGAVEPKPAIETVTKGPGVLYWSVDAAAASRSVYAKLAAAPVYKHMTIRTIGTVHNILSRLDDMAT